MNVADIAPTLIDRLKAIPGNLTRWKDDLTQIKSAKTERQALGIITETEIFDNRTRTHSAQMQASGESIFDHQAFEQIYTNEAIERIIERNARLKKGEKFPVVISSSPPPGIRIEEV